MKNVSSTTVTHQSSLMASRTNERNEAHTNANGKINIFSSHTGLRFVSFISKCQNEWVFEKEWRMKAKKKMNLDSRCVVRWENKWFFFINRLKCKHRMVNGYSGIITPSSASNSYFGCAQCVHNPFAVLESAFKRRLRASVCPRKSKSNTPKCEVASFGQSTSQCHGVS